MHPGQLTALYPGPVGIAAVVDLGSRHAGVFSLISCAVARSRTPSPRDHVDLLGFGVPPVASGGTGCTVSMIFTATVLSLLRAPGASSIDATPQRQSGLLVHLLHDRSAVDCAKSRTGSTSLTAYAPHGTCRPSVRRRPPHEDRAGNLRPGDSLPTFQKLSKQWSCSLNPVRAAVTPLKQQGFISGGRGKGPGGSGPSPSGPPLLRTSPGREGSRTRIGGRASSGRCVRN
jgi:Bacterial regulatory proteins, gntR family